MIPSVKKDRVEVNLVDLTCRSLPYDVHLITGLQDAGIDVHLWVAGCLPEQQRVRKRSVLDVAGKVLRSPFRRAAKGFEYLINGVRLQWGLHTKTPDIVHYQWLPFAEKVPSLEVLNLKFAKRSRAGVVYTVHNVLPHDTGDRYRSAFEQIYQIPDALICHTEESQNQLVRDFGISTSKIWVIPHGPLSGEVENVPQDKARDRLNLNPEIPLCLLFGFIRPYKGVEFLIESWKRIKEQEPAARLILAGQPEDGYGEVLLDKIGSLNLDNEIDTHFEFLSKEKLSLYIQASDVLVYPYRDITQSGAFLTGLTTGKPVVATDVGGFREIIRDGETGLLVDYGNEEQLSEELVGLLQNSERRKQLGQAAREMVETEYSWDAISRKTLECYKSVIISS